jgi:hypothetical protein
LIRFALSIKVGRPRQLPDRPGDVPSAAHERPFHGLRYEERKQQADSKKSGHRLDLGTPTTHRGCGLRNSLQCKTAMYGYARLQLPEQVIQVDSYPQDGLCHGFLAAALDRNLYKGFLGIWILRQNHRFKGSRITVFLERERVRAIRQLYGQQVRHFHHRRIEREEGVAAAECLR